MYGGDLVIVNDNLANQFGYMYFKTKVFLYPDDALKVVRSIELLKFLDEGKLYLSDVNSSTSKTLSYVSIG